MPECSFHFPVHIERLSVSDLVPLGCSVTCTSCCYSGCARFRSRWSHYRIHSGVAQTSVASAAHHLFPLHPFFLSTEHLRLHVVPTLYSQQGNLSQSEPILTCMQAIGSSAAHFLSLSVSGRGRGQRAHGIHPALSHTEHDLKDIAVLLPRVREPCSRKLLYKWNFLEN